MTYQVFKNKDSYGHDYKYHPNKTIEELKEI